MKRISGRIGAIGKANLRGRWLKPLPLVAFSLIYLIAVTSACSSGTSGPESTPMDEEPSPTAAVGETPTPTLPTGDAEAGRALFLAKACTGCHTVQGMTEAQGKVGPELTHVASNDLIAGALPFTEENLKRWLKDPAAVKPGTIMPNQGLTDSEIDAIIAFLRTLK